MSSYLQLSIEAGIATITLDDRQAKVNTVSPAWIAQMSATFEALQADTAVRGVVITSAKSGFMAGADLNYILDTASGMTAREAFDFSQNATRLHRLVETCGKPVVAAMTGFALGGGYELALACTYRILSEAPDAVVGLPEVSVGLLPGSGGTQRLPRMIGVPKALEVLLEGKSYSPQNALELGMVDLVKPRERVVEAALSWLQTAADPMRPWDKKGFRVAESDGLLKQSTAGLFTLATAKLLAKYGNNYPAPIAILTCVFEGIQVPLDKGLLVESRHFAKLLTGSVARNIIRTGFVNRGRAEKGARRPKDIARSDVKSVGILGAGMMGAGIAFVTAQAGLRVVLLDTSLQAASNGKAQSGKLLARDLKSGKLTKGSADRVLDRIRPTEDYQDLADVDLVIEAVFEDVRIKSDVVRKAQAVIGKDVLFASNTSTLPITQLAAACERPADFIGLHFFSPVARMALVEIIMGRATSQRSLARAMDFVAQIRKTPILVNDSRGFYTSRVFQTFIHEGLELLREGVAPALIENAARQAGMPLGPLAVLDEVSLELPMKIIRETQQYEASFQRPASMDVLETMVERLERPGRKAGAGFYEYCADGGKRLWPALAQHFAQAAGQPAVDEVKRRLLYIQALESARCLEEGVVTHSADADLGAVLGWGFPTWTGGTLSLIDTVGVKEFVAECERLDQNYGRRFMPTARLRDMADTGARFAD